MKTYLLPVLVASALITRAPATNFDWLGTSGGDWTDPLNWNGGGITFPAGGDDQLTFPIGAVNKTMNQNFAAGTNYWRLIFDGSAYVLNGNSLHFVRFVTSDPEIEVCHASGTTTINAPFTVSTSDPLTITVTNSGATLDLNGAVSGSGDIFLVGAGVVRYDAAIANTGTTRVGGPGTTSLDLIVTGSTAGPMTVDTGGFLHGSGTIGNDALDDLTVEGTISPGDPSGDVTGNLLVNGDLIFSTGSTVDEAVFDLQGFSAGSTYDQIDAAGPALNAGGAEITLRPNRGFTIGTVFTLINKISSGAISGEFLFDEGTEGTFELNRFRFSYLGGDGNDFTATVVAAPSSGTREWDAGGATQETGARPQTGPATASLSPGIP